MENRSVLRGLIGIVVVTVVVSLWLAFRAARECAPKPGDADASAQMDPSAAAGRNARADGDDATGSNAALDHGTRRAWTHHGDGALIGRVLELDSDRPIAGATVVLTADRTGPRKPLTTRTDDSGFFELPRVPAFDAWTLTVQAPVPFDAATMRGIDVRADGTTDVGVVHLDAGLALEGIVVTEDGLPIAGALVRAMCRRPGVPLGDVLSAIRSLPSAPVCTDSAETGEDGRFALRALPPGTCDLITTARGFGKRWVRDLLVVHGESDPRLRIVLPKGATLAGHVAHRLGGSVAGLSVAAFSEDGMSKDYSLLDKSFTTTGANGAFTFEGLDAEAEYWLCVTQENGIRTIEEDVEIPPDDPLVIAIGGGATLTGTVTDEDGKPIEGAELILNIDPGSDAMAFAVTYSDADGRYVLSDVPVDDVDGYLVTAEGYLPYPQHSSALIRQRPETKLKIDSGENVVDFRLSRASMVRGVVVEQGTNEPLPDVRVSLLGKSPMLDFTPTTRTDASGAFELVGIDDKDSKIVLLKEGWTQLGANENAEDGDATTAGESTVRTFEMARSVSVRGVVLSPEGEPVSGARVTLVSADAMNDGATEEHVVLGGPSRDVTDSAGHFELPGVGTDGRHAVHASLDGFLPARSAPLSGDAGRNFGGVEVRLRRPATLLVKVTRTDGQPIAGATVDWSVSPDRKHPSLEPDWSRRTRAAGDDGVCRVEGLDTGTFAVTVRHKRYLPVERKGIAAGEGEIVNVDITLEQGGIISGVVLGPDGEPFSGATIEMRHGRRWHEKQNVRTEGRLELIGLEEGTFDLRARAHGTAASESVKATVDGPPVTIRLRYEHPISGRVLFPDGTPARYADVDAYEPTTRQRAAGRTDGNGGFTVDGLLPGNYTVTVSQGQSVSPRPNLLRTHVTDIAAGTSGLQIEVQRGETVTGRVYRADGKPASRGELTAENLPPFGTKHEGRPHTVKAHIHDGWFQATGLLPGRVRIRGRVDDQDFEVTTTTGTDDLRIDLPAPGAIRGRVVGPDGTPVSGAQVRTTGPGGTDRANTRTNGLYQVAGLAIGSYQVKVTKTIDGTPHEATATDVLVTSGQTTTVRNLRLEPTEMPDVVRGETPTVVPVPPR